MKKSSPKAYRLCFIIFTLVIVHHLLLYEHLLVDDANYWHWWYALCWLVGAWGLTFVGWMYLLRHPQSPRQEKSLDERRGPSTAFLIVIALLLLLWGLIA